VIVVLSTSLAVFADYLDPYVEQGRVWRAQGDMYGATKGLLEPFVGGCYCGTYL
jgi:hypothetical protein